jgi:hypothetical protein
VVFVGPGEVHPQEHLGPVGGLGPAGPGADREDRPVLVVFAREQQRGPLAIELLLEGRAVSLELGLQVGVGRFGQKVERSLQVGRARQQ